MRNEITAKSSLRRALSTAVTAIIIVILVIAAAGIAYYYASSVAPGHTTTVSSTPTSVTLTVWLDYAVGSAEYRAFNQTVAGFKSAYPYINLNLETKDPNAQESDFTVAALAGQAPDVVRGPSDWTGTFVAAGDITPLTQYVNSTFLGEYFSAALNDFTYQGHLWGLPENINGLGLVYNKAMLPNGPPTTTTQLLSECPSLTKTNSSGAISTACIVFPLDSGYWWWPFLTGFGGSIFSPTNPNMPLLNSTAAVQSIEFRNSLINNGFMPYQTCCNTMVNMFETGHAAMIIDGPWDESNWAKNHINYGIAALPTVSSTGDPMGPLIGAQGWFIASGKPVAETNAAFKFITWFTNEEHQTDEFKANGDLPSLSALASSSTFTGNATASGYLAQASTSQATPNFPAMGQAYSATGSYLSTIAPATPSQTITTTAIKSGLNSVEQSILKAIGSLG